MSVPIKVSDKEFVVPAAIVAKIEAEHGKGAMDQYLSDGPKTQHPNYENLGAVTLFGRDELTDLEKKIRRDKWLQHGTNTGMFVGNIATQYPDPQEEQTFRPAHFDKRLDLSATKSILDTVLNTGLYRERTAGGNTAGSRLSLFNAMMDKYSKLGQLQAGHAAKVGQLNRKTDNQYGLLRTATDFRNRLRQHQFDVADKNRKLMAGQNFAQNLADISRQDVQTGMDYENMKNRWEAWNNYTAAVNRPVDSDKTTTPKVGVPSMFGSMTTDEWIRNEWRRRHGG